MSIEIDVKLFNTLTSGQFAGLGSKTIKTFADQAALNINCKKWGAKAQQGLIYLTAHTIEMSQRKGKGGLLEKEKVGEIEKEYDLSNTSGKKDVLDFTSWGQEFKRIRKTLQISPLIIC